MTDIKNCTPTPTRTTDSRRLLTRRRDLDFTRACSTIIERYRRLGRQVSDHKIVEEALSGKAPEYYVSLDHSLDIVSRMLAGRKAKTPVRLPLRQLMWEEIAEKVSRELNRRKKSTLTQCVADVLRRGGATRYFMSFNYALRIFRNHFKTVMSYESI